MEILIEIIAEFFLDAVIAVLIFLGEGMISLVAAGISHVANSKKLRRLALVFSSIFLVFFLTVVLVNMFFLKPVTRMVLSGLESKTGIHVAFKEIEGNLFTGKCLLKDVTIQRENHPGSRFDLRVADISIDVNMFALFTFRSVMDEVKINRLEGEFRRVGVVPRVTPRKAFLINHLTIKNSHLQVNDATHLSDGKPLITTLNIPSLECTELNSRLLIFDVLFMSNGRGVLGDSSFAIEKKARSETNAEGSRLFIEELPLQQIGAVIGGPFHWLTEGGIQLEVNTSRHGNVGNGEIQMDWKIVIRNVKAKVPENYSADKLLGKMAGPVVDYINKHSRELVFQFHLNFPEKDVMDAVTLDDAGLWKASRIKIAKELILQSVGNKEKLKELGKKGIKRFKDYLDKKRLKKEE